MRRVAASFAALLLLLSSRAKLCADALDHWHLRNPLPQGNTLRAAACGGGLFFAVGDHGTIATSPDGATWTVQSSGVTNDLAGAGYGNGVFIAVGSAGCILTSSNAVAWRPGASGTNVPLRSVTFANGTFVAAGGSGAILTSTDATTWTYGNVGTEQTLSGVTFGAGKFVAVSDQLYPREQGYIFTSADGVHWASTLVSNSLFAVTWGNGIFVAIGGRDTGGGPYDFFLASSDGVNWTRQVAPSRLLAIAFAGSNFVAAGQNSTNVLTSTNGIQWTSRPLPLSPYRPIFGLAACDGFVAVGWAGTILTSATGEDWILRSSEGIDDLRAVSFGNGTFVAPVAGDKTNFWTSADGVTWTRHHGGPFASGALACANGLFVWVGDQKFTSADGINWTNHGDGFLSWSIVYGNGMFVSVAGGSTPNAPSTIYSSPDGVTWTQRPDPRDYPLYGVAYGAGRFVAVGPSRDTAISTNGTNWTIGGRAGAGAISITFGNGLFVASSYGGSSSNIATSMDGVTWTEREVGVAADLWNVLYADGIFIATGQGPYDDLAVLLTSLDGVLWTRREIPVPGNSLGYSLGTITYGQGTFVIVGNYGLILQSDSVLPRLSGRLQSGAGGFELSVTGGVARSYRLEASTDPAANNWSNLFSFPNTITNFVDTTAGNFDRRFYRVVSP